MKVPLALLSRATVAAALALAPALAQAQEVQSFVRTVDVSDQAVSVKTQGRYGAFVMKVSGPDDFYMEQRLPGNKPPRLLLRSNDGVLADGHYTIEISAEPIVAKGAMTAMKAARESGNPGQLRQAMTQAGLGETDLVHSFGVRVMQGRFLDPSVQESGDFSQQASGWSAAPDALDAARALPRVQPASFVADATEQGPPAGFEAGPQVSNASLNRALAAAQNTEPLPAVVAGSSAATVPWTKASFRNVAENGTAIVLDGYLRPVRVPGPDEAVLVEAYFRQRTDDSTASGGWYRAYFQPQGDGFRLVQRADVERRAGLFDYVASEEEPSAASTAMPDFVINDDLIVDGSACIGFDCVNGESFGFDTMRLKENNLRVHFDDTSNSASFPRNDWRLEANQTTNGGAEWFAIQDATAGRNVFTVTAGAPANSIFVSSAGRLGLRTATPAVELHMADGDTPTVRLQQDGTNGFTPQTWDVAGNEAGYFVRDATNGSTLPFRIRPGAPSSSIDIAAGGNVGIGAASPSASLHVRRSNGTAKLTVEETNATSAGRVLLQLTNNGAVRMEYNNTNVDNRWQVTADDAAVSKNLAFNSLSNAGQEMVLSSTGNLTLLGQCEDASGGGTCADYVFEPDYELPTLDELEAYIQDNKHLPNVPSTQEIKRDGISVQGFTGRLLEKIEELTLYTIEQHKTIQALEARLAALEAKQQ